jgi:DNA-binding response OmpR family regulator
MAGLATVARERPLVVNEACWEITHAGRPLSLTITQYRLLRELVLADEHTVPTPHLARVLFGSSHHEHDRVAAHVKRVRRRLLGECVTGCRIDAVRGFGYRLAWAA